MTTNRAVASIERVALALALGGLALGGVFALVGDHAAADATWAAVTALGIVPAAWSMVATVRNGHLGVDVMALLALVGALVVNEYVAGAVITVMLMTGRALEAHASGRARRDLHALLDRTPRVAHRYEQGTVETVELAQVCRGDVLLVRSGEVLPVDGLVEQGTAIIDESALTGEPLPVERHAGDTVRSGTVNAGASFDLGATTSARDSTYAGIVRLVSSAAASSAPFVRLADRYAGAFVVVSLALAGAAWAASGELVRAVAVLVVATPCPLILAAPVAITAGIARAARRGVIVKGGGALERLARSEVLLFDKTGTLTAGSPALAEILTAEGVDSADLLARAASLEQVSPHVVAGAIVRAARARDLALDVPRDTHESPGDGVRGTVRGHEVAAGKASWIAPLPRARWVRTARRRADLDGTLAVFVEIDRIPAGALLFDDPIRSDASRTIRRLRRDGIRRVVMVTGDRADAAQTVGAVIGVDEVLAERTPAEKVDAVRFEQQRGPTVMVGDGINDAPALAAADVGVAIGARGATASSEAADVVLTIDRLDRVGEALVIARRSRSIALESVVAGIGMSAIAMVAAAFGLLPPAWGALLQEAIDVAVIVNALRALRAGEHVARLDAEEAALTNRFRGEHAVLRPDIGRIRRVADALGTIPSREALARVRAVHRFLVEEIAPHDEAEDKLLYPVLARVLGGDDPTGTMSRGHVEIAHQIRLLGRVLEDMDPRGPDDDDVLELRRLLYGLHAILELHFEQEDEGYFVLETDVEAGALRTG